MAVSEHVLKTVEESLERCAGDPVFLDRFYEVFLASSPKVKVKFAQTNFFRQKRALQASLHAMLAYARNEAVGDDGYLREIADRHSRRGLDIGADYYDLWLDSLLTAVRECDPLSGPETLSAWENAMLVGIHYFLSRY